MRLALAGRGDDGLLEGGRKRIRWGLGGGGGLRGETRVLRSAQNDEQVTGNDQGRGPIRGFFRFAQNDRQEAAQET